MFDIGFWEMIIIAVVALVVIGPERLPGIARKAGFWVGKVRRWVSDVKDDVSKELRAEDLRQAIDRNAGLKEIQEIVRRGQEEINKASQSDYLVKAIDDDTTTTTDEADSSEALEAKAEDIRLENTGENDDDNKAEAGKQSAS